MQFMPYCKIPFVLLTYLTHTTEISISTYFSFWLDMHVLLNPEVENGIKVLSFVLHESIPKQVLKTEMQMSSPHNYANTTWPGWEFMDENTSTL